MKNAAVLSDALSDYLCAIGAPIEIAECAVTSLSVSVEPSSLTTIDITIAVLPGKKKPGRTRGWRSVEESLPETDDPVLVCNGDAVCVASCDDDGEFVHVESFKPLRPQPTHWMLTPATPEKLACTK